MPTTTSTTTSSTIVVPWIATGPIRWTVLPPEQLRPGDTAEVAVAVDAPALDTQVTLVGCGNDVPPERCAESPQAPLDIRPIDGDPDATGYRFTVTVPDDTKVCAPDPTTYLLPVVSQLADDGTWRGPFHGPLAYTRLAKPTVPRFVVYPTELAFTVVPGVPAPANAVWLYDDCGPADPSVSLQVTADASWITVTPDATEGNTAWVTVDSSALPARAAPYDAMLNVTIPGVLDAPRLVPVTMSVAPVTVRWATRPPAEVAAGASFPIGIEVIGEDVRQTFVDLQVCEAGHDACVEYPLDLDSRGFESPQVSLGGGPGVTGTVAHRLYDCRPDTALELRARVEVPRGAGSWVQAVLPPAPFRAIGSTEERVEVDVNTLDRTVYLDVASGASSPLGRIGVRSSCRDGRESNLRWVATTDRSWLHAEPGLGYSNAGFYGDVVTLSADPTDLDPRDGPYDGHVTFTAADPTRQSATVPVVLQFHPDIHVQWLGTPPYEVHTGDDVVLPLSVRGDVTEVRGTARQCLTYDYQPFACYIGADLGFPDDGWLEGPPGTFMLRGHVPPACYGFGPNFLQAGLSVWSIGSDRTIALAAPLLTFIRANDGLPLSVTPSALTVAALPDQQRLFRTISVALPDRCWSRVSWNATADVPWLSVSPTDGEAVSEYETTPSLITVAIDTTALDPGEAVHLGHVRIDAPAAEVPSVVVPVWVEVAPPTTKVLDPGTPRDGTLRALRP